MKFITLLMTCSLALGLFVQPGKANEYADALVDYYTGEYAKALQVFRPLAERGNAKAQVSLGNLYFFGEGVPQDYAEPTKWYLRAADQRNAEAYYRLGLMYTTGEGVLQDYEHALMWFNLAAAAFSPNKPHSENHPKILRDLLTKLMNTSQIAEAQRLAREWLEAHPKK